jgi:YHS domain-containing protein
MIMSAAAMALTGAAAHAGEASADAPGSIYTLATCPVTGAALGSMGAPIVKKYDGREVRFCCAGCVSSFEADKEAYFKKIDAAVINEQKKSYPLDTCLVSGQKLGSMGESVDLVYRNRLVRLCCEGCRAAFQKEPAKYLKKLDAAIVEKQKGAYPVDTCVVSGEKLGAKGDPVDYIAGGRLVRFCCSGCVKEFEKDPRTYLDKLDAAAKPSNG